MLSLQKSNLKNKQAWTNAGIELPDFDIDTVSATTKQSPTWIHFGAGNIFRGFIAELQQQLLNAKLAQTGIIAVVPFDYDMIERIFTPFDNLTLLAIMNANATLRKKVIASVTEVLPANSANKATWERLCRIFSAPELQMVSFTITEKGYSLHGIDGSLTQIAENDMKNGNTKPVHTMSVITALLYERYKKDRAPLALVSMDNCSHNGETLQKSICQIAQAWIKNGFLDAGFMDYLSDEQKIAFPWTMIDKITPRPAASVQKQLEALGITNIAPITTKRNSYTAPFVNAEPAQYLVIEDKFPAGRPAFEKLKNCGVYMTDRDTVNRVEQMKVTACLNPLHTALAVYGCLLGYKSIAEEMKNPYLTKLIKRIGYDEGLPVVTNPRIINPADFIEEVITKRLPNPNIPDTPQRIATDTSQKIPVRFGETIKSYISQNKPMDFFVGIPLAIAGWFRYLLAVDDNGNAFEPSSDPMLEDLQKALAGVRLGEPNTAKGVLPPLLKNKTLFGTDLTQTVLAQKIESYFIELTAGRGAVAKTLEKYV